MSVESDRLISLVEFAYESARLRSKPAATVAAHGIFSLFEHQIQALPGIVVNAGGYDSHDEIWLAVKRLQETKPPEITNPYLRPWAALTQSPTDEPALRDTIDGARLIAAGTHCSLAIQGTPGKPAVDLPL